MTVVYDYNNELNTDWLKFIPGMKEKDLRAQTMGTQKNAEASRRAMNKQRKKWLAANPDADRNQLPVADDDLDLGVKVE